MDRQRDSESMFTANGASPDVPSASGGFASGGVWEGVAGTIGAGGLGFGGLLSGVFGGGPWGAQGASEIPEKGESGKGMIAATSDVAKGPQETATPTGSTAAHNDVVYSIADMLGMQRPTPMPAWMELVDGVTTRDSKSPALDHVMTAAELGHLWRGRNASAGQSRNAAAPSDEGRPPRQRRGADVPAKTVFDWRSGAAPSTGVFSQRGRSHERLPEWAQDSTESRRGLGLGVMGSGEEDPDADEANDETFGGGIDDLRESGTSQGEIAQSWSMFSQQASHFDAEKRAKHEQSSRSQQRQQEQAQQAMDATAPGVDRTSAASDIMATLMASSGPLGAERHAATATAATAAMQEPGVPASAPQLGAPAGGVEPLTWYYTDLQGRVQGPFASEVMREWLEQQYLSDDLPIRCGTSGVFVPLRRLFPTNDRAFLVDPRAHGVDLTPEAGGSAHSHSGPSAEQQQQIIARLRQYEEQFLRLQSVQQQADLMLQQVQQYLQQQNQAYMSAAQRGATDEMAQAKAAHLHLQERFTVLRNEAQTAETRKYQLQQEAAYLKSLLSVAAPRTDVGSGSVPVPSSPPRGGTEPPYAGSPGREARREPQAAPQVSQAEAEEAERRRRAAAYAAEVSRLQEAAAQQAREAARAEASRREQEAQSWQSQRASAWGVSATEARPAASEAQSSSTLDAIRAKEARLRQEALQQQQQQQQQQQPQQRPEPAAEPAKREEREVAGEKTPARSIDAFVDTPAQAAAGDAPSSRSKRSLLDVQRAHAGFSGDARDTTTTTPKEASAPAQDQAEKAEKEPKPQRQRPAPASSPMRDAGLVRQRAAQPAPSPWKQPSAAGAAGGSGAGGSTSDSSLAAIQRRQQEEAARQRAKREQEMAAAAREPAAQTGAEVLAGRRPAAGGATWSISAPSSSRAGVGSQQQPQHQPPMGATSLEEIRQAQASASASERAAAPAAVSGPGASTGWATRSAVGSRSIASVVSGGTSGPTTMMSLEEIRMQQLQGVSPETPSGGSVSKPRSTVPTMAQRIAASAGRGGGSSGGARGAWGGSGAGRSAGAAPVRMGSHPQSVSQAAAKPQAAATPLFWDQVSGGASAQQPRLSPESAAVPVAIGAPAPTGRPKKKEGSTLATSPVATPPVTAAAPQESRGSPAPSRRAAKEEGGDNGQPAMSADMRKWCAGEMRRLAGIEDLALLEFCMGLPNQDEVREYIHANLGSSPAVTAFANEFIDRKSFEPGQGWRASGKGGKRSRRVRQG